MAKKARQKLYIACEFVDMIWDQKDVLEFDRLWGLGMPLGDIADHFGRPYRELWLLMIDRYEKNRICSRPGGILGELGTEVAHG